MKETANDLIPKHSLKHLSSVLGITSQAIYKKIKTAGLPVPKTTNKSFLTHNIARKVLGFEFKRKKVSFHIVKGGTGKTATVFNVACAASAYGAKILAIDLDPQANLSDSFNVNADNMPVLLDILENHKKFKIQDSIISVTEGIDLLPSRIENATLDSFLTVKRTPINTLFDKLFAPIIDKYDFVLIDCPPAITHSTAAATLFVDTVVVPLNPDSHSSKGFSIIKEEIDNLNSEYANDTNYMVFLNKHNPKTLLSYNAIQTTVADEAEKHCALTTIINQAQEIPNATGTKKSLFASLKKSNVREDFAALAREILEIKPVLSEE